jgi:TonB family protein
VLAGAGLASLASAQTGDPARGRPVIPDQEGKAPERPADPDSMGDEPIGDSESQLVVDEPGAPAVIVRVAPAYPSAAARTGIQGTVLIVAHVLRDGTVARARVTRSIPALDEAAVDAVRGWTFQPTRLKGRAVEQDVAIPIRFLLPLDPAFDWRAARRGAAASERASRPAEAFVRLLAAFRGAVAVSAIEADSIRGDLLRVAATLPPPAPGADLRVVPVEARIALAHGDSLYAAAGTPGSFTAAAESYTRAGNWAPWHPPVYRRLAAALEKAGDRAGAEANLRKYLDADPRAPDRAAVAAELARLGTAGR